MRYLAVFLAVAILTLALLSGCESASAGEDDDDSDHDAIDDADDDTECSECLIEGTCWVHGAMNPENPCLFCDVEQSNVTWSINQGAQCDDGVFCNGLDTCLDGQCSGHTGNPCPDDGLFCNGVEECYEDFDDCSPSISPCDGIGDCESRVVCDEQVNECYFEYVPCADDGNFCNGEEQCDEYGSNCIHTGNPCPDDGQWCNGAESCNAEESQCDNSGDPCDDGFVCEEDTDECVPLNTHDDDDDTEDAPPVIVSDTPTNHDDEDACCG